MLLSPAFPRLPPSPADEGGWPCLFPRPCGAGACGAGGNGLETRPLRAAPPVGRRSGAVAGRGPLVPWPAPELRGVASRGKRRPGDVTRLPGLPGRGRSDTTGDRQNDPWRGEDLGRGWALPVTLERVHPAALLRGTRVTGVGSVLDVQGSRPPLTRTGDIPVDLCPVRSRGERQTGGRGAWPPGARPGLLHRP